jgi:PAS domain S-box-containing protein
MSDAKKTRAQLLKELNTSEERFRSVVEGSPQGILIHQDGIIQYANPACAQMFGYDHPTDLLGRNLWETLFASEVWQDIQTRIMACLQGERLPVRYDWPGVRKDSTRVWIASTGSIISWKHRPAVVSFYTDMTAQKRLEEQLQQAHKMEAIGTLAGGIAHDFNNILAAILGYTELALFDAPSASPLWHNLQEVLRAGTRARDLVQQILTFSRQSGLKRRPVQLHLVVKEALTLLRASLPTTIDIHLRLQEDTGAVLADPTQMHQVLMNLCANAAHAMRDTGGTLELRVEATDVEMAFAAHQPMLHPGPHVRLTVRDTGHGMTPEVMARIFEPFFTTKQVGEGTGMGLAVVHGIVASHGGAITVDSTPGEGTRFDIYLPRVYEIPRGPTPQEASMPPGKGCILFVDDEAALAHMGGAILEHLGYDVVVSTGSRQALDAFRAMPQRFDLVITDQTMPHMTGEVLAQELRCLRPDIPIILCTGYSPRIDAEKAKALSIDAFLMKPWQAYDLARIVQEVMAPQKAQRT